MGVKSEVKASHEWFIGERKQLAFPIKDSDGLPVDASGWDIEWALMKNERATEYLIHKTSGNVTQINVVNGPENVPNVVVVQIEVADAINLRPNVAYYHELKRTDDEAVLSYGPATLKLSGID